MGFAFNAEIAATLAAVAEMAAEVSLPPAGDVLALRATTGGSFDAIMAAMPESPDVEIAEFTTTGDDGAEIALRWYRHRAQTSAAAVVYAHGGGMICGTARQYDPLVSSYVQRTGVPFLSVDYRLAPEYSENGLARDVYAAIRWLRGEAAALGVDPERIAVMGDSGGGGVAAGAAIIARDEGVALAAQILLYPMLDDRSVEPDPAIAPFALWNYEFNRTAWTAVLGDERGGLNVSPHVSPARLADFAGLPASYIEVGEVDIFRDEAVAYAQGLWSAGVTCELHVHPGAPHAYDLMAPSSKVAQYAFENRLRAIRGL